MIIRGLSSPMTWARSKEARLFLLFIVMPYWCSGVGALLWPLRWLRQIDALVRLQICKRSPRQDNMHLAPENKQSPSHGSPSWQCRPDRLVDH